MDENATVDENATEDENEAIDENETEIEEDTEDEEEEYETPGTPTRGPVSISFSCVSIFSTCAFRRRFIWS